MHKLFRSMKNSMNPVSQTLKPKIHVSLLYLHTQRDWGHCNLFINIFTSHDNQYRLGHWFIVISHRVIYCHWSSHNYEIQGNGDKQLHGCSLWGWFIQSLICGFCARSSTLTSSLQKFTGDGTVGNIHDSVWSKWIEDIFNSVLDQNTNFRNIGH